MEEALSGAGIALPVEVRMALRPGLRLPQVRVGRRWALVEPNTPDREPNEPNFRPTGWPLAGLSR